MEDKTRLIHVRPRESSPENEGFPTNEYKTCQYKRCFVLQILMTKFFNPMQLAFFVSVILNFFPQFDDGGSKEILISFYFVIWLLSALTEILAEKNRIKNDKARNSEIFKKMVNGQETDIICSEIKVGDILRIYDDQVIPADCILLSSYELMAF